VSLPLPFSSSLPACGGARKGDATTQGIEVEGAVQERESERLREQRRRERLMVGAGGR
jgi:hypothetical protein